MPAEASEVGNHNDPPEHISTLKRTLLNVQEGFKTSPESFLHSVNSCLPSTVNPNLICGFCDAKPPRHKTKACGWSVKKEELPACTWKHQKTLLLSYEDVTKCEPGSALYPFYGVWCEAGVKARLEQRWASWGVSQHRNTRSDLDGETDGQMEEKRTRWVTSTDDWSTFRLQTC